MSSITVADDALGRAVRLISAFCGNPLGAPAQGASTSAQTGEGTVTGLAACATALAGKSAAAADLLGRDAAEAAQVRPAARRRSTTTPRRRPPPLHPSPPPPSCITCRSPSG